MSGPEVDNVPEPRLRGFQITIGALLAGILSFAGIALFLRAQGVVPLAPDLWQLAYVAIGFGAAVLLARAVALPAITAGARMMLFGGGDVTTAKLLGLFGSRMITGAALLEGGAFTFLVTYLMRGGYPGHWPAASDSASLSPCCTSRRGSGWSSGSRLNGRRWKRTGSRAASGIAKQPTAQVGILRPSVAASVRRWRCR
jgi:hypothetical protein